MSRCYFVSAHHTITMKYKESTTGEMTILEKQIDSMLRGDASYFSTNYQRILNQICHMAKQEPVPDELVRLRTRYYAQYLALIARRGY